MTPPILRPLHPVKDSRHSELIPAKWKDAAGDTTHTVVTGPRNRDRHTLKSKPPGDPGKPNSGGYTLWKSMGFSKKKDYDATRRKVGSLCKKHLDIKLSYSRQAPAALKKVFIEAAEAIPMLTNYEYHWATKSMIIMYLKSSSAKYRATNTNPSSREIDEMLHNLHQEQIGGSNEVGV